MNEGAHPHPKYIRQIEYTIIKLDVFGSCSCGPILGFEIGGERVTFAIKAGDIPELIELLTTLDKNYNYSPQKK